MGHDSNPYRKLFIMLVLSFIVPILALFGTAGSAVSTFNWVVPLRPYLLAATVLILSVAFYGSYKPAAKDECGCGEKQNWTQSKSFLWIVAIV